MLVIDKTYEMRPVNVPMKENCLSCSKSAVIHFWCNHETPVEYSLNDYCSESKDYQGYCIDNQ